MTTDIYFPILQLLLIANLDLIDLCNIKMTRQLPKSPQEVKVRLIFHDFLFSEHTRLNEI